MASTAAYIAGGLLQAAGQGMVAQARQKWEETLAAQERADRKAERTADREHDVSLLDKRLGQDRELAEMRETGDTTRHSETLAAQNERTRATESAANARNRTDRAQLIEREDGSLAWTFPDGSVTVVKDGDDALKGKKFGTKTEEDGGISPADDRYLKRLEESYGLMSDGTAALLEDDEGRASKRAKIADKLKADGRPDLARLYEDVPIANPANGDPASPGTAMAGDQAPGTPQGKGSQAEPYKAATQADIDWFKANAQPGEVIEVNGQLYTK